LTGGRSAVEFFCGKCRASLKKILVISDSIVNAKRTIAPLATHHPHQRSFPTIHGLYLLHQVHSYTLVRSQFRICQTVCPPVGSDLPRQSTTAYLVARDSSGSIRGGDVNLDSGAAEFFATELLGPEDRAATTQIVP
jgi:hypothetical protein